MRVKYLIPILVLMLMFTLVSCSTTRDFKKGFEKGLKGEAGKVEEVEEVIEEPAVGEVEEEAEVIEEPIEEEIVEEPIEEKPVVIQTNSRTSPAIIGDVIIMEEENQVIGKVKYEIELLEVISGDEAWEIIKKAWKYNEELEEGREYILAKFRVKVLETEEDEPFGLRRFMFDTVSGQGIEYTDYIRAVHGLDPDLHADLYEGAEHIGWTYFIVDKEDNAPVVAMNRKSDSEIWFQMRY